jgi:hypothetical protein
MQEIHIMHPFNADFYGHEMKAIVLGYIRPELDYTSRGSYQRWFLNYDPFLTRPPSSPFPSPIDHPPLTLVRLFHVFHFSQRTSLRILRPTSASRSGPSCGRPIKSSRMTNTLILPPSARFALEYLNGSGTRYPEPFGLRLWCARTRTCSW